MLQHDTDTLTRAKPTRRGTETLGTERTWHGTTRDGTGMTWHGTARKNLGTARRGKTLARRREKCGFYTDLRIFTQVLLRLLPHLPPKPHPHPRQRGWGCLGGGPGGGGGRWGWNGLGGMGMGLGEVGEVADIARLA